MTIILLYIHPHHHNLENINNTSIKKNWRFFLIKNCNSKLILFHYIMDENINLKFKKFIFLIIVYLLHFPHYAYSLCIS